jgi:hypothetical protein
VPLGQTPTAQEGKERLEYLQLNTASDYVFSFAKPFVAPHN